MPTQELGNRTSPPSQERFSPASFSALKKIADRTATNQLRPGSIEQGRRRKEGLSIGHVTFNYTYRDGSTETADFEPGIFVIPEKNLPKIRSLCRILDIEPPPYLEIKEERSSIDTANNKKNDLPRFVTEKELAKDIGDRLIPALFNIENKYHKKHFDDMTAKFFLDRTPEGNRRAEEFLSTARGPENEFVVDDKGRYILDHHGDKIITKITSDSCSDVIGIIDGEKIKIHSHGKLNGNDKVAEEIMALMGYERAGTYIAIVTENHPDLANFPFEERPQKATEIAIARGMHETDQVEIETMTIDGEAYATASVLATYVHDPEGEAVAEHFATLSREKIVGVRDIFREQPSELQEADAELEEALIKAVTDIRAEIGGDSDKWRLALTKLSDDRITAEDIKNANFDQQPADKKEANKWATIAFAFELEKLTRPNESENVATTTQEQQATNRVEEFNSKGYRYVQHGIGEESGTIRHFEKGPNGLVPCDSHVLEAKELLQKANKAMVEPLQKIAQRTEVVNYQQYMQQFRQGGIAKENHAPVEPHTGHDHEDDAHGHHHEHPDPHEDISPQAVRMLQAVNSLRVPKEEALDSNEAWVGRMRNIAETSVYIASLPDNEETQAVREEFNKELYYGVLSKKSLEEGTSDALRKRREELKTILIKETKDERARNPVDSEAFTLTVARALDASIKDVALGNTLPDIDQITPKNFKFVIKILARDFALVTQHESIVKTKEDIAVQKLAAAIRKRFDVDIPNPSNQEKGAFHFNEIIKGGVPEAHPCAVHTQESVQKLTQVKQQAKKLVENNPKPKTTILRGPVARIIRGGGLPPEQKPKKPNTPDTPPPPSPSVNAQRPKRPPAGPDRPSDNRPWNRPSTNRRSPDRQRRDEPGPSTRPRRDRTRGILPVYGRGGTPLNASERSRTTNSYDAEVRFVGEPAHPKPPKPKVSPVTGGTRPRAAVVEGAIVAPDGKPVSFRTESAPVSHSESVAATFSTKAERLHSEHMSTIPQSDSVRLDAVRNAIAAQRPVDFVSLESSTQISSSAAAPKRNPSRTSSKGNTSPASSVNTFSEPSNTRLQAMVAKQTRSFISGLPPRLSESPNGRSPQEVPAHATPDAPAGSPSIAVKSGRAQNYDLVTEGESAPDTLPAGAETTTDPNKANGSKVQGRRSSAVTAKSSSSHSPEAHGPSDGSNPDTLNSKKKATAHQPSKKQADQVTGDKLKQVDNVIAQAKSKAALAELEEMRADAKEEKAQAAEGAQTVAVVEPAIAEKATGAGEATAAQTEERANQTHSAPVDAGVEEVVETRNAKGEVVQARAGTARNSAAVPASRTITEGESTSDAEVESTNTTSTSAANQADPGTREHEDENAGGLSQPAATRTVLKNHLAEQGTHTEAIGATAETGDALSSDPWKIKYSFDERLAAALAQGVNRKKVALAV